MTTRQRHERQSGTYRALIGIAEEVVASARMVLERTGKRRGKDMFADLAIDEIRRQIAHYCGLGSRVIDQARRRVLDGEQVPTAEKIYSIFEPHTDLIKRGKVRAPIEFGHKVFLAESAQGLITQYEVLKGNPADEMHVMPSLQTAQESLWSGAGIVWLGPWLLQRAERRCLRARRRQGGMHSAARRQQNSGTLRLREERGVQVRAALSRRHRRTHLGPVPRSWHEALPRRGDRTV